MKELTDVQYEAIGKASRKARMEATTVQSQMEDSGRAAYAASFPYAIAEALAKPSSDECSLFGKRYASPSGCKGALLGFLSERACDLIAKPDPALEAVKALTINWKAGMKLTDESAREVVAAVDAARAK